MLVVLLIGRPMRSCRRRDWKEAPLDWSWPEARERREANTLAAADLRSMLALRVRYCSAGGGDT